MAPDSTSLSRRRFLQGSLTLASLGLLSGCGVTMPWAQSGPRTYRIGWLAFGTPAGMGDIFDALRQGLGDLGYLEGQNLLLEARWAEDQARRLPELAQELVRLSPEVIVTQAPRQPWRSRQPPQRFRSSRSPSRIRSGSVSPRVWRIQVGTSPA